MMEEKYGVGFEKLNLKPEDILIIKVDTIGLSEEESLSRLSSVRNDGFVKYIQDKGNAVLVAYSGLNFEVLRTSENDKVLVYAEIADVSEESEKYLDYIKFKLKGDLGDKVVVIPTKKEVPLSVKISKE
nr:MAG: hypothetical protein [Caudoviricetes sp.]